MQTLKCQNPLPKSSSFLAQKEKSTLKGFFLCVIKSQEQSTSFCFSYHSPNVIPFLTENIWWPFGLDAVQMISLTRDSGCINRQPISVATVDPAQLWGTCRTAAALVQPTSIILPISSSILLSYWKRGGDRGEAFRWSESQSSVALASKKNGFPLFFFPLAYFSFS